MFTETMMNQNLPTIINSTASNETLEETLEIETIAEFNLTQANLIQISASGFG